MPAADIEERVKKVTAAVLKANVADLKPESEFVGDLGAESMQSIELVAAFEAEFDIEMDEDKALAVQTVGDAIEFIKKTIEEQS